MQSKTCKLKLPVGSFFFIRLSASFEDSTQDNYMTDETKRKIAESMKGKRNKVGAKLSDEAKEKIRAIRIGSKWSQEVKAKMSKAHQKYLKPSEEEYLELVEMLKHN